LLGINADYSKPHASVVLAVYGDLRFLDETIDSILAQDLRDIELVIIDDGTGEHSRFEAIRQRDARISLITNSQSLGAAAAANLGIGAAQADIIVRIDADDIAEPARVGRLVAAFDDDPELGVVGSAVTLIDEGGHALAVQSMPETDLDIRWTIHFYNPFYHPAVAFRRSCFEAAGRYRPDELVSQDHYLWFDMLPFCRARNLAEPLIRYRLNPRGLTALNLQTGRSRTHAIRVALWKRLGLTYDLYDNALASDVNQFLRGFDIQVVERRAPAYSVILSTLRAFLAAPDRLVRAEDQESARKLAQTLVTRIAASPPRTLSERLSIFRLCWSIRRRTAFGLFARQPSPPSQED
jgi:glycosyltransferase involved in cell wall biosynthesis